MDYRRFGDTLLVRIDRGEEILEQVKTVALKENIQLASVQALGALGSFTVGVYKVDEKKYYANSFEGSFEIVSLTGTIDTMNGEFYTHLHLSAGQGRGVRRSSEPCGGQRDLRDGHPSDRRQDRPSVRRCDRTEPV